MSETPKCPYCGAEMKVDTVRLTQHNWVGWYHCENCRSVGPSKSNCYTEKDAEESSLSAALHRAEPEMRPLTLDEATASEDPVWLEAMGKVCIAQINLSPGESLAEYKTIGRGYAEYLYCGDYGILWRCWPRKPTPEQMAAEKWEE